ncbi:MAG: hypothetical protein U0939_22440 [Pirellulales bacterium]
MANVKLSDNKPCAFCGTKEDTLVVKDSAHAFQAVLCPKHMVAMLKRWEGVPAAEAQQPQQRAATVSQ